MENTSYNGMSFASVSNLADFCKTKLPEMPRVRAIFDNLKVLFAVPSDRVILEVVEGERIYKYTVLTPDIQKSTIGWFVFIPENKQLDVYVPDDPYTPLAQWKSKKLVFSNYPIMYTKIGFDRLFAKVVNLIQ